LLALIEIKADFAFAQGAIVPGCYLVFSNNIPIAKINYKFNNQEHPRTVIVSPLSYI
jgi:hypothetical protein